MHSLEVIKKLNREAQDKFEEKEVITIKPDLEKKIASRLVWFAKRASLTTGLFEKKED